MARTAYELTFRGDASLPTGAVLEGTEVLQFEGRTIVRGPLPGLDDLTLVLDRVQGAGLELLHVRLTLSPEEAERDDSGPDS